MTQSFSSRFCAELLNARVLAFTEDRARKGKINAWDIDCNKQKHHILFGNLVSKSGLGSGLD